MARKKGTSEEVIEKVTQEEKVKRVVTEVVEKLKEYKEYKFSKKQILSSKRFEYRRDAVGAILDDDKTYSIDEVEKLYEEFMKGEVK